jgi:hypothetical protein
MSLLRATKYSFQSRLSDLERYLLLLKIFVDTYKSDCVSSARFRLYA